MESHNVNTERVESFIGRPFHAHIRLVTGKTQLPRNDELHERPVDSSLHLDASFTPPHIKELAPLPEYHIGVGIISNMNFHVNDTFPILKPDAIPLCVDRLTERAERELRVSHKRPELITNNHKNSFSPPQKTQPTSGWDQTPAVPLSTAAADLSDRSVPVVDRVERNMYVSSHLRHQISQHEQIEAKLLIGAQKVSLPPDTTQQPLLFSLQQPTTFTDRSERLVKRDWASNSHKLCCSVDHTAGLHNGQRT